MKKAASLKTLKKRHPACKLVRRKKNGKYRLYVINKIDPRYKAKQG